ncbi:hypothetical protein L596_002725 [Steinernema carpocapsae]|uniref:Uncharacterized protein n=1 Tax=Steinernema carpocapsae TaxID=34508 RepID=A0A4U8UQC8_STECR|nr:hypothetical protein L596_002725 [Steinernema carpocapsae]
MRNRKEAAKQPENSSKSTQNPPNCPKTILSYTCRRGCRRTFQSRFEKFGDSSLHTNGVAGRVAGLVAGGCSISSLSPCHPATGRRQPRRQQFEHPVAVAVAVTVAVAVAHELERSVRILIIHKSQLLFDY